MEGNEIVTTNEELNEVESGMDYEVTDDAGSGIGKLIIGAGVVAMAGLAAFAYKNRAKYEEKKIERLRKKGYVIYKEDECEVRDIDEADFVEEPVEEADK